MAIITISRGSYSKGKEIAEKVAERLGYECIARAVLLEASDEFNIPEIKLIRALHDAPSVLDRFTHGKKRFIAYIEEAFLRHVQKDNVVYHGLGGHFFLKGVSHAIKVRIIADLEDRVRLEMARENISEDEARHILKKDDSERHKWALALYGIDTKDARLYDLVINIRNVSVDDAVDIICHTAGLPHFQTTPKSQKALDNLLLAAHVKDEIIKEWPDVNVSAMDGLVVVHVEGSVLKEDLITEQILGLVENIPGVREARVHVRPSILLSTY